MRYSERVVNCIDGRLYVGVPAPGGPKRWPANALCDLGIESDKGPSAAVYMNASDVRTLVNKLRALLPPAERGDPA